MRYSNSNKIFIAVALLPALLLSCTGKYEDYNTNPDAIQQIDSKSHITTMIMDAVIPCSDVGANEFQRACNLMGDAFCGYLSPTQAFNGGSYTCTYDLDGTDYNNYPFSVAFTAVMPAWLNLKYAHENGLVGDEVFAVAEVIKVMALQRVSDIYGPLPVSHFGEDRNPYESQETVYKNLFNDLDWAIGVLSNYASESGATSSLSSVDPVFNGDYSKWYKLANSEKLRMALRIRYVEPELAQRYAEEAVEAGVMTAASDGAWLKSSSTIQVFNPLEEVWNAYRDTRMGATMDCYLNGYMDPRLPVYFSESTVDGGGYHGVRSGIRTMTQTDYTPLSAPNVSKSTPVLWMLASEVAFLRSEGALVGWNMGGDASLLYEEGVCLSFEERGLSSSAAMTYLTSTRTPVAFEDKNLSSSKNSYQQAPSDITPAWVTEEGEERNLERIITQKWIAMFPNGQEAWSEFRRTGYPRVIPVKDNLSDGKIDTQIQVRRMTFPRSEYANNLSELNEAVALIGGSDNGGVRLWWDKK